MKSRVKPRWIVLSVLAVVLAAVVVAVGAHVLQALHKTQNNPKADVLAAQMVQELGYSGSYVQIAAGSVQKYYPVDTVLVESEGLWIASGSDKVGELCCFRLHKAEDAAKVKTVIGERLNSKAQALHALNADQYRMVQNAAVVQDGSYLLVAVSADPGAETELFKKLLN